jgi:hypothetical protein
MKKNIIPLLLYYNYSKKVNDVLHKRCTQRGPWDGNYVL